MGPERSAWIVRQRNGRHRFSCWRNQRGTSLYVTGNLSEFDTGSYSITNTRTGFGSPIHSAVYNATTNRTLIACQYSAAWATAKVVFAAGDPFQIARVSRVLDQTGLGRGKLLSGSNPTATPLAGAVREPSYAWNNTQANGSKVIIHSEGATFVEGRDYFNSAPPVRLQALHLSASLSKRYCAALNLHHSWSVLLRPAGCQPLMCRLLESVRWPRAEVQARDVYRSRSSGRWHGR